VVEHGWSVLFLKQEPFDESRCTLIYGGADSFAARWKYPETVFESETVLASAIPNHGSDLRASPGWPMDTATTDQFRPLQPLTILSVLSLTGWLAG